MQSLSIIVTIHNWWTGFYSHVLVIDDNGRLETYYVIFWLIWADFVHSFHTDSGNYETYRIALMNENLNRAHWQVGWGLRRNAEEPKHKGSPNVLVVIPQTRGLYSFQPSGTTLATPRHRCGNHTDALELHFHVRWIAPNEIFSIVRFSNGHSGIWWMHWYIECRDAGWKLTNALAMIFLKGKHTLPNQTRKRHISTTYPFGIPSNRIGKVVHLN